MAIEYINSANTFSQWLVATQDLITVANNLTDGGYSQTFYANTNLSIGGDLTVTGNLTLDAVGYDDMSIAGNTDITGTLAVTGNSTFGNITVSNTSTLNVVTITTGTITTGEIASANIVALSANIGSDVSLTQDLYVGANANVYGDLYIAGDTTFGGNVVLDAVGFNDLDVAGNADITLDTTIGGTLGVTGNATFVNAEVTDTLTANIANVTSFIGTANTSIYDSIAAAEGNALAFSIALG